jgi:hypothetical protein
MARNPGFRWDDGSLGVGLGDGDTRPRAPPLGAVYDAAVFAHAANRGRPHGVRLA